MKSPFCSRAEFPPGTFNLQSHSRTIHRVSHYRQTFYHTSHVEMSPNVLPRVNKHLNTHTQARSSQKINEEPPSLQFLFHLWHHDSVREMTPRVMECIRTLPRPQIS